MAHSLQIAVLAALTVFVVSSFPTTGSAMAPMTHRAVTVIHCENSEDCPSSSHCKVSPHKKTGICVGAHVPATTKKK
jgi:hypothetical protein